MAANIFEAEPIEGKKKRFLTAAFPYPNSPQHIGHARTYSVTDAYARYLRHLGYNVLFPMAFHVTGTPIIAMAQRIAEGDKSVIDVLMNIYGIPKEKLPELTDPKKLVMYFSQEVEQGMKEMGFSIDWRRKFYTFDPHFNKFIEWQFHKLKEAGLLVKGSHPVAWSLKLNSAMGSHDTKGDVDPEIEEVVAIKFPYKDGFLLATTYRPETLFGLTNMWINPEGKYLKIRDKESGEIYYISKGTLDNFSAQRDVDVLEELDGNAIIEGGQCKNPANGEEVPIFPATFVDVESGTGVVMSVPAHAPFDYVALRDLGKEGLAKKIINVPGYDIPAKDIVEKMHITNQQDPKLEQATKRVYKDENMKGKMLVWKEGMPVKEAKEAVKEWLINDGKALRYYIIANGPVYSRAGDKIVVKLVKDQWFITYGNKEWKEKAYQCLEGMKTIPPEIKQELKNTVDWLDRKACTRSRGLGTKFPFDEGQMIESLSDSTIYPAFYTISHLIKDFSPEELTVEFFDYVLLGKGEPINDKHAVLRKSFDYWYPVDSRHSGPDLIRNHLTFYIMNHVAIFPREKWPRQIVINGFVLMDGKKMSKSLGNILPLRKAIKEHGADIIRFSVVSGSDLLQDTNFNRPLVEGIKQRLAFFDDMLKKSSGNGDSFADKWIRESVKAKLSTLRDEIERLDLREISKKWFYDFYYELKWYNDVKNGKIELDDVFDKWLIVLEPLLPFFVADKKGENAVFEPLPEADTYDEATIAAMGVVRDLYSDIANLQRMVEQKSGKKPSNIKIIVPAAWKYRLFERLKAEKGNLKAVYTDESLAQHKEEIMRITKALKNKLYSIPSLPTRDLFEKALEESKAVLATLGSVSVISEEECQHEKAKASLPLKPAVVLE